MREGWTYKKLGEVCDVINGFAFKSEKFTTSGCPILRISNIQDNLVTMEDQVYFHLEDYKENLDNYIVYPNDIVVAMSGATTGKCGINKTQLSYYLNQRVCVLREKDNLQKLYLFYFIQTKGRESLEIARGVAQPNLSTKQIKDFIIPLPPKSQQEAIVSELDEINSLLALKREQLQKYDKLAQSLFYEMFGDPVENEKGWEAKELNKCVEEMFLGPFGSALKVECYVPEDKAYAMVYEQKHAIQGRLDLEKHFISKEKFDSLSRFEVLPGDFIMSCRGTIGKIYQLPNNASRGIIHPSLMKIRIKEDVYSPIYFIFMLRKIVANETTNGNCVQMAITAKELGRKQLPLPPLPIQQQFASRIEQIESQKQQVQAAIEKLETLLASRMQYWFE